MQTRTRDESISPEGKCWKECKQARKNIKKLHVNKTTKWLLTRKQTNNQTNDAPRQPTSAKKWFEEREWSMERTPA
jgi:hypothetical protein